MQVVGVSQTSVYLYQDTQRILRYCNHIAVTAQVLYFSGKWHCCPFGTILAKRILPVEISCVSLTVVMFKCSLSLCRKVLLFKLYNCAT
jgi:hypothetical protein